MTSTDTAEPGSQALACDAEGKKGLCVVGGFIRDGLAKGFIFVERVGASMERATPQSVAKRCMSACTRLVTQVPGGVFPYTCCEGASEIHSMGDARAILRIDTE